MTKHAAARTYNISESTLDVWLRKYAEGGQEALLEDNRGRKPSMGRKPKPKLSDYEPGSLEYLKLENEMMKRELLLLKSRMTSTWKERCYPILDGGWEPVIV